MTRVGFFLDRTAVLFLGVAAGAAIGYAFAASNRTERDVVVLASDAPAPSPVVAPPPATAGDPKPDTAPPPPATPAPAAAVAAAAAPVEAAPIPDTPLAAAHEDGVVRIGVFGDSFGDGVWSALYRLLPAKDGFRVTKYSQQSTGFTRYRSLNLEEHDAGQIAAKPVDIAVISFGANDAQGVYANGHGYKLMSSGWQDVIGQRIDSYVAMLRRTGATVYWVGLPKMRDAAFDADIAGMNAFYADRMRRLGVPFIDVRPLTVDGEGKYTAYMAEDGSGATKLFRANDGIHMSMNGYVRITKGLASRIRQSTEAARAARAAPRPQANPA
ncbi:GDSL-type esterase/lipase family protein [Sphingomonas naphthae]|uniref:GDSL-type esterase/lipase family protein n=1 Tax=Sphingomonas naphthae TaxID=1813468 RepID=A0ABY7TRS4_9SPHN|nr:GDSL-type esterase/lipase family protein [Sphingomonas naphthae]WCT75357.1 GDSL-type esterase/lipase family protein [Sphingomonas naphthae]